MKKTLIALAALAATGASFAQVTISGKFVTGYTAVSDGGAATSDRSGLGVDTSEVYFTAVEDLGGGMSVTGKMGMGGLDRSGETNSTIRTATGSRTGANLPVTGRNFSLAVNTGSTGTVTLSTTKQADYLSGGIAGVGALYQDLSDIQQTATTLLVGRERRDALTYSLPIGPFKLDISHNESAGAGLGVSQGGAGATSSSIPAADQRLNQVSGTYVSGALTGNVTYSAFDNRQDATSGVSDGNYKDNSRIAGAYDLGPVKLGAGYEQYTYTGDKKITQTLVGLNAPIGAFNLGAQWAQKKTDNSVVAAANGTQQGYGVAGTYSLSKRTSIISQYTRFDPTVGAANATTAFNLFLAHSF